MASAEHPRPKLSVIVVTFHSASLLRETLEALFAQTGPSFEAILLDNGSTDASVAIAREYAGRGLRLIERGENLGFAGGNNEAVRHSRGEIVFLLNPDAILEPGGLAEIERAFAERPEIGVLGARLLHLDGRTLQHCGGRVDLPAFSELIGADEPNDGRHGEPREVPFVVGAAMALRRQVWEELGGFDEDFNPAYYEDTDLCFRARRAGRPVVYWPGLVLRHRAHTSCAYASPLHVWTSQHGRLWFSVKHFGVWAWLTRGVPGELRWLMTAQLPRGMRWTMLRIYWHTFKRWVRRRLLRDTRPLTYWP